MPSSKLAISVRHLKQQKESKTEKEQIIRKQRKNSKLTSLISMVLSTSLISMVLSTSLISMVLSTSYISLGLTRFRKRMARATTLMPTPMKPTIKMAMPSTMNWGQCYD
jgi:hypothetical protein